MQYVIDELRKCLKYNMRQLEENLQKIRSNEESIESLKRSNEKHKEAIKEISGHLEQLEQADLPIELPFEKQPISIIEGDS